MDEYYYVEVTGGDELTFGYYEKTSSTISYPFRKFPILQYSWTTNEIKMENVLKFRGHVEIVGFSSYYWEEHDMWCVSITGMDTDADKRRYNYISNDIYSGKAYLRK
jgi:hypothetical protein